MRFPILTLLHRIKLWPGLVCKNLQITKMKFVLGWLENTDGKRRKMLATSIFSFSHNVFKILLFHGRLKMKLHGKCWIPAFSLFPTMFSKFFFSRVVKS